MQRVGDWKTRLWACLNDRRRTPFAWGTNDCAIFAADALEAMTGVDLAAPFRGTYSDEAGADQVLADNGWADLGALADAFLERIPDDARAQRGDVILIDGHGITRDFLAICLGADAVGPGDQGLQRCRIEDRISAWRVL